MFAFIGSSTCHQSRWESVGALNLSAQCCPHRLPVLPPKQSSNTLCFHIWLALCHHSDQGDLKCFLKLLQCVKKYEIFPRKNKQRFGLYLLRTQTGYKFTERLCCRARVTMLRFRRKHTRLYIWSILTKTLQIGNF